jgi:pimeloyl-ACP methyl ester carboxylesterase
MDDLRAVMDAVGSTRAAILGMSEGGPKSIVFAATYPIRTSALILYGAFARQAWAPDYTWGRPDERLRAQLKWIEGNWGQGSTMAFYCASVAGDPGMLSYLARVERSGATPGAVQTLQSMNQAIDVRHVLPTIAAPTMVLHRTDDPVNVEHGRYLARHIKQAKYVEFPGIDH